MAKFLKIHCLDSDLKDNDYMMHIRPHMIVRVDTAAAADRKRRVECNSVVVTGTGSVLSSENAQQLVDKLEEMELIHT